MHPIYLISFGYISVYIITMSDQRMKQKFEKDVMSVRWTSRNVTKSKHWCCGVDSDYVCPSSLTNRVGLVAGFGASPGSLVLKAGSCFRPDLRKVVVLQAKTTTPRTQLGYQATCSHIMSNVPLNSGGIG